jgi:lipoprotein-releasing system permease protein
MRWELFIGLRYLRARRREAFISLITLLSTLGIAFGVMTLNIVLAVMTGFERDLRDRILSFNAHVTVGGRLGPMAASPEVLNTVRAVPGVVSAQPFFFGPLMLTTPDRFAGVALRGIPPTTAANPDLAARLRDGRVEQLDARYAVPLNGGRGSTMQLPGIILGAELMRELGLEVGETVSVASSLADAAAVPVLRSFVVVGVFDSGMVEYDRGLAYANLADAQRLYDLGDAITGIDVKVADVEQAAAIAARIGAALGPSYFVSDWMQKNFSLFHTLTLQKTAYFIVLMLIVLVAAFTVLATLIMVVMEKRKDIAVLKSIGAPSGSIARVFVLKGLIIGVIGTMLGNLGGYAGCWVLRRYKLFEIPQDIFLVSTVPVAIYPPYFVAVSVAALAVCLLATLYPARQAARLVPVDIMRYE